VVRKMEKQTLGILITVAVLVLVVGVFAYLNAGDLERKKELETSAEFILIHGDQEYRVSREKIVSLGPVEFSTVMRTSTTEPTNVIFSGVELRVLLEDYEIAVQEDSIIEVKALDGYVSAFEGGEVLEPEHVYITIAMNGEPHKPKSEGGVGPYYLVLRNSTFAQRWVKFMEEIRVQ
jgi:nitrogen fixation-related uncharacterized protein